MVVKQLSMRRTGFHSIKMADWTKQTAGKDFGRGIDAMLREKRENIIALSPCFVCLMPPFLDCTERCKQVIHFDFWQ